MKRKSEVQKTQNLAQINLFLKRSVSEVTPYFNSFLFKKWITSHEVLKGHSSHLCGLNQINLPNLAQFIICKLWKNHKTFKDVVKLEHNANITIAKFAKFIFFLSTQVMNCGFMECKIDYRDSVDFLETNDI